MDHFIHSPKNPRGTLRLPGSCAVAIEDVKVLAGEQLAAIDARLNGAEAAQNTHLLHVADERYDVEALQLGVDGVQTAHQVLEEELEGLRQAEHGLAADDEGGHLLAAILDQFALVGAGIRGGDGRRAVVGTRRHVVMGSGH